MRCRCFQCSEIISGNMFVEDRSRKEILRGKALTDALLIGWFYITATLLFHAYFFFEGWEDLPGQYFFLWKDIVIYMGLIFWAIATLASIYRLWFSYKKGVIWNANNIISIYGPWVIGLITTIIDIVVFAVYPMGSH